MALKETINYLPIIKIIKGENYEKKLDFFKTDNYDLTRIETTDEYNRIISNRMHQNVLLRKLISEHFEIPIFQFLQPNAYINYQPKFYSDFQQAYLSSREGKMLKNNYTSIYNMIKEDNKEIIDLSYLFDNHDKAAIIDVIHYSPDFNLVLAKEIIKYITIKLENFSFYKEKSTGDNFKPNY